VSESSRRLKELIEKAMEDLEISASEYQEILAAAGADSFEDPQERALLAQFQEMMSDGTIKRVRG